MTENTTIELEKGPLPDDLHGGTIITMIRSPIDRLGQYMSVSTLLVRDGKTWLLGSQNVNLTTVVFGPAGGLIRVETPIVAQNL
jgi:hypothetical protein